MSYEELEKQALKLTRQQRSRLVQVLLESLNEVCLDLPVTPLSLVQHPQEEPPTALESTLPTNSGEPPALRIPEIDLAFQRLRKALSQETGEG